MKQGLLFVHLHDCLSRQDLIVATTHLKAKNGLLNEETRRKEVGLTLLIQVVVPMAKLECQS